MSSGAAPNQSDHPLTRRVGRILEELDQGLGAGGAIIPDLPSRRDHSRRRRGRGATPKAAKGAAKAARFRAVHPEDGGGSLPAPVPAQTRGLGERMPCPKGNGDKRFQGRRCRREAAKGAAKGGYCPLAANCRPRNLRNRRQERCPPRGARGPEIPTTERFLWKREGVPHWLGLTRACGEAPRRSSHRQPFWCSAAGEDETPRRGSGQGRCASRSPSGMLPGRRKRADRGSRRRPAGLPARENSRTRDSRRSTRSRTAGARALIPRARRRPRSGRGRPASSRRSGRRWPSARRCAQLRPSRPGLWGSASHGR